MVINVDDAWAEDELERQLRSLTPIDCLEEAEQKLNQLRLSCDEEIRALQNVGLGSTAEEEKLPDSAESFFSLIQHNNGVIEQELEGCQALLDIQVDFCGNYQESECGSEDASNWEEELNLNQVCSEDIQIAKPDEVGSADEYDKSSPETIPNIQSYRVEFQADLPIYQVSELVPAEKHEEQRQMEAEAQKVRVERERERNENMRKERERLEQLQQEELRKIEEEVRLAEEELKREMAAHEQKMRELTEQQEAERKRHQEAERGRQEEMRVKKRESATKIQAHFRGMRTRKIHQESVQRKIEEKRNQLLEEKLRFYEEVIREEKAAVEAEIEAKRQEEEEKKRAEARAEEIRLRHLEKERLRREEAEKKLAELQEMEKAKKADEEERSKHMADQSMHWLQNNISENNLSGNLNSIVNEDAKVQNAEDHPGAKFPTNDFNTYDSSQSNNLNKSVVDNHNMNHRVEVENKQQNVVDENDNSKKSRPSFFENITSKAKNLFSSRQSADLSEPTQVDECKINNRTAHEVEKERESIHHETVTNTPENEFRLAVSVTTQNNLIVGNCEAVKTEEVPEMQVSDERKDGPSYSQPSHDSNSTISPPINCPTETPIIRFQSKTTDSNSLLLSLDSALSSVPHRSPKTTSSFDLIKESSTSRPKNVQIEAKAEYRRKRKLREDITFAREISDVDKKSLHASSIPAKLTVNWDEYINGLVECMAAWRGAGNSWPDKVKPPSTASSGRFLPRNFSAIQPRTVNETTVVENQHCIALRDVGSLEVYVSDSSSLDIFFGHGNSERVDLLSLQRCDDANIGIVDSSVKLFYQNDCGVGKLEKVPSTLLLMDLSRNVISRLNPVSCSNLVMLTLSRNSLVSTRGLQYLPHLVHLDLSFNSLSTIQHIDKCGLLQHLDVSHNQLVNIPSLQNNILLSHLNLSANGLTDVDSLSSSWLPCLRSLSLVANGLSTLPQLYSVCPLLKSLDVSNNMLTDTELFLASLRYCRLEEVMFEGTELNEAAISSFVESMSCQDIPNTTPTILRTLTVIQKHLGTAVVDITALPVQDKITHLENRRDLAKKIRHHLVTVSVSDLCNLPLPDVLSDVVATTGDSKSAETVVSSEEIPDSQFGMSQSQRPKLPPVAAPLLPPPDLVTPSPLPPSPPTGALPNSPDIGTLPISPAAILSSHSNEMSRESVQSRVMVESHDTISRGVVESRDTISRGVAMMIQCLVRGFRARVRYRNMCDQRDAEMYREYRDMSRAALRIQRVWRGFTVRNMLWQWLPWLHHRKARQAAEHTAATKIQAVYRGYSLRRRLEEVFAQAVYDLSDCDDLDEMCSIDFDETELDRGWDLPPTPSLQHHAPLPPTPNTCRSGTFGVPPLSGQKQSGHTPSGQTSRRWSHSSSVLGGYPRSQTNLSQGPVPLLPLNRLRSRENSTVNSIRSYSDVSVLSLPPSRRASPTKRQMALVEEWGVKDKATAQKLIQRSKKFGKHMSTQRKRELIRERILEGSSRKNNFLAGSPPPPSANSGMSSSSEYEYQWDISALKRQSPSPHKSSVPLQVYKNPRFCEPANNNVRLPPLSLKRRKPSNRAQFK